MVPDCRDACFGGTRGSGDACTVYEQVDETNEVPIFKKKAVIYGSPRRHSNSFKTFKKIGKN